MKFSFKNTSLVFLAGIGNSLDPHWQRRWLTMFDNSVWIGHQDWDFPDGNVWVREFDEQLRTVVGRKLLICHSLGCLLVSQWLLNHQDSHIVGGLFVALPDPNGTEFPTQAVHFDCPRPGQLPFRSFMIASENDPYSTLSYSRVVAEGWGARFLNIGPKGHINSQFDLGDWDEGADLLKAYFAHELGIDPVSCKV
jgi:predicted alpha/beta hydrolase family esterase